MKSSKKGIAATDTRGGTFSLPLSPEPAPGYTTTAETLNAFARFHALTGVLVRVPKAELDEKRRAQPRPVNSA